MVMFLLRYFNYITTIVTNDILLMVMTYSLCKVMNYLLLKTQIFSAIFIKILLIQNKI